MQIADNLVFIGLAPAWFVRARQEDMRQVRFARLGEARFALVELCALPVPPDWPQFGIELTAGWARRGWQGGMAPKGFARREERAFLRSVARNVVTTWRRLPREWRRTATHHRNMLGHKGLRRSIAQPLIV